MKNMFQFLLVFSLVFMLFTTTVSGSESNSYNSISQENCDFQIGEIVEVYDPIEKNWFTSKILKNDGQKWFIHYDGYDSKWDTWATCDRIRRIGESKTTPGNSTTSQAQNTGNSSQSSVTMQMPTICPTQNITLNVGDPILIKQTDSETIVKLSVTNLEFKEQINDFKIYAVEGYHNVYFNWNDIQLDPNYTYTTLPETVSISKNEVYNIGDQVETSFGQNELVSAVIVSKDGDNYYLFFDRANSKSSYYDWRFVSDIRSPGSSKDIILVSQNGNPKSQLEACKNELNTCYNNGFSNKWDFLWYYRHDMNTYKGPLSLDSQAFNNPETLEATMKFYECMYQVRKKYPDVGYAGRTISDRYDVQYEFLKDYKNYIKKAFDLRINAVLKNIVTDTENGFYQYELARTDGKKLLKDEMVKACKDYEVSYKSLGGSITYPEALLNTAYDKALVKFMNASLEVNDGLVNEGHTFAGKDARVEQLCIADLQTLYPGAKVLKSGCYNNEFLVELNSLGVPIYRTKTVLIIFQSSLFRTTVEAKYTLREEYVGNNQYGKPSFPRRGTLTYLK